MVLSSFRPRAQFEQQARREVDRVRQRRVESLPEFAAAPLKEFGIWNSLPQDLRHCSTLTSFKAKLKTFLFSQYLRPN